MGLFFTHIPFVVNHTTINQRNAIREVATHYTTAFTHSQAEAQASLNRLAKGIYTTVVLLSSSSLLYT